MLDVPPALSARASERPAMAYLPLRRGAELYFKDWGEGPPIVFSHGYPLTSDCWDAQMLYFSRHGFRVIAHDRRGHGRSSQTWEGNHMDQYADDLADLIRYLNLRDVVLVGHSTGGGEVARYIGRHGTERVAKVVLLGAVAPLMVKTETNPEGQPIEVFDQFREGVKRDRSGFFKAVTGPFYGYNREGSDTPPGLTDNFWRQGMMASIKAAHDCIAQFSEVDFTEDLRRIDVPTLIAHSDDDQIVPIAASAYKSSQIVRYATLLVYEGLSHGLAETHPDRFNADLLDFIRQ
jgi:non-heme chloroperoxidase